MLPEFSRLTADEQELMYKAPLLVCILIAGADGEIDNKEINEAINLAKDHQWVKYKLTSYFQEVSEDFEDKIKMLIQAYPFDVTQRTPLISNELAGLNSLWGKIHPDFAASFYDLLKFLAHRIAASSGGFWSKISTEEAVLIELPMILSPQKL